MRRLWKPQNLVWVILIPLVWWALGEFPIEKVWETLSRLSLGQILILIFLNTGILMLLSGRWWIILRAQGYTLPYLNLVGYRLAAFGISYFTPGPQFGGEPLQIRLARERHYVPGSTALAAVTLDKMLELLANFTFLTFGLIVALRGGFLEGRLNEQVLFLALILLSLPSCYLLALRIGRRPFTWLSGLAFVRRSNSLLIGKVHQAILSAEIQIASFCKQKPLALFQATLFSVLVWVALLVEYWISLRFLGLQFNLMQTIIVLTAARLAFLSPSPGGLGALEASQVLAMQVLGIDPALGISMSLLIRARDITIGGLGIWWGSILSGQSWIKACTSQAGD